MHSRLFFLCSTLLLLLSFPLQGFATQKPIVISFPEQIIASSIKAMLPIQLNQRNSALKGQITIVDIDNLQINDGGLACHIQLAGQNMALTTQIADQNINLNVGSLQIAVNVNATLRFDPAKQILYLRPTITDTQYNGDGKAVQVGPSLVSLFNNQEFPIALQPLQPFLMESGSKQVAVTTHIINVLPQKDILQLHLLPKITSQNVAVR